MNPHDHRAQFRESPEPEEGTRAIPKVVLAWIAILIVWGVGYYAWQIGKPMLGGDSRSAVATLQQESQPADNSAASSGTGSSGGSEPAGNTAATKPDGKAIYSAQCSACHQANGQGVPGAFPPLAGSEWLLSNAAIPVAIVHDGLQGKIEVAGNSFQGVMPKFGGTLSDAELAAVLSYARSEWGNSAGEIDPATVTEHKERFGDRKDWSAEDLKEVFGEP
ncbi:c-type cytochrome [Marinobacter sp.]|uniref:c-type cytochrome n=1 Tax=Marinobacter sp. TaxID=50741 RepID=UPI003A8F21C9